MDREDRPRGPSKAIAARHVAKELGVSISTVSRAFSPNSNVAPETRERILSLAKEIGYRPNPFARSLITQRTRIVSIFISDVFNPFFPEAMAKLTQALQGYGMTVMLFHVPDGKTPDEVLPEALLYKPEYIIIMTATVSFQAAMVDAEAAPRLIFFNRYVPGTETFSVTCDNEQGGRALAQYLIETGHRRMGFIAGTPDATTSIDRGRGFVMRCAEEGIVVLEDKMARIFSYEDGYAGAIRLLRRDPDLEAIFCANDIVAMGAIDALHHELGLHVPDDISVVGYDDVAMAGWPSHLLTTYSYPTDRMAEATVDLIRELDADPDLPPVARRVSGELIVRSTARDRSGGPPHLGLHRMARRGPSGASIATRDGSRHD